MKPVRCGVVWFSMDTTTSERRVRPQGNMHMMSKTQCARACMAERGGQAQVRKRELSEGGGGGRIKKGGMGE